MLYKTKGEITALRKEKREFDNLCKCISKKIL